MSTRGAIGIRIDGINKVYYNHFDSYPEWMGIKIINFCKDLFLFPEKIDQFKQNARQVQLIPDYKNRPTKSDIGLYKDVANLSVSNQELNDWYCLLKNYQGINGLLGVLSGKLKHFVDNFDFLKDGLFCEYAYIIDLDNMFLELYDGCNEIPLKEEQNPFNFENVANDNGFYPVKLVGKIKIDKDILSSIDKEALLKYYE